MILYIHSDAYYLSESESRSRAGGIAFLSSPEIPAPLNGAIHVHSSIMKMVLASAAEAEVGALFFNAQDASNSRHILMELGHPKPPTAIQTDNACAHGIMNATIEQKRSKAIYAIVSSNYNSMFIGPRDLTITPTISPNTIPRCFTNKSALIIFIHPIPTHPLITPLTVKRQFLFLRNHQLTVRRHLFLLSPHSNMIL
jgi:hypothetical protein